MKNLLQKIKTVYFLIKNKVNFESHVYIEGFSNIELGTDLDIKYRVRIRSRTKTSKIKIGNSVKLREFSEINAKGNNLIINDYCFIAKNCWIGGSGNINIGTNSMIGIGSIIISSNHDYHNIKIPYCDNSEIPKDIKIGKNVWIGAGAIILGGSEIGSNSVVSAGSVVNGVFPENSLITGVPGILKSKIVRNE